MVQLTERAVGKVKEIMGSQEPAPAGLRIAVVGGGCSGFGYSMAFENTPNMLDKTYNYDGLKVLSTRPACFTWMVPKSITWRRWKVRASSSTTRTSRARAAAAARSRFKA